MPMVSSPSGWGTTGVQWDASGYGVDQKTGNVIDKQGNIHTYGAGQGPQAQAPQGNYGSYSSYMGGLSGDKQAMAQKNLGGGFNSGYSSTTSLATGGTVPGGYNANAQLAQVRDEFRRMRDRTKGARYEEDMARGILSSGVGAKLMSDEMHGLNLQEGASIERILNDLLGRQQAFDLQKQQMDYANQLAQK